MLAAVLQESAGDAEQTALASAAAVLQGYVARGRRTALALVAVDLQESTALRDVLLLPALVVEGQLE